jgi:hypothetical protein
VFTIVVIESLDKMGITVTVQDRDAYFHLWLVIGHLLGIDYDRLRREQQPRTVEPLTYAEMQLIARVVFGRHRRRSRDGELLMLALTEVSRDSMPRPLKSLPQALTRQLIGNEDADIVGVPPAGAMRLVTATLRPVNAMISPYLRSNALGVLGSRLTRSSYEWWIGKRAGNRPAWRFRAPWLEPAPTRIRRRADEIVDALPGVPRAAKNRISGLLNPG